MSEAKDLRFLEAPGEEAFDDEFLAAPELEELAGVLIGRYRELSRLGSYEVRVAWKREAAKAIGKEVDGKCSVLSGALKHYAGGDWFIWLAADACSVMEPPDIEALLYHELLHCDLRGKEKRPSGRGHDVEMFFDELLRYGLWRPALRDARDRFGQLSMPAIHPTAAAEGDLGESLVGFRRMMERGIPADREELLTGARVGLAGGIERTLREFRVAIEEHDWPARVMGLAAAVAVEAFVIAEAYEGPRLDTETGEVSGGE